MRIRRKIKEERERESKEEERKKGRRMRTNGGWVLVRTQPN